MSGRLWWPRTLRRRIGLLLTAVLLLWLTSVIAAAVVQSEIANSRARLTGVLRPSQVAVAQLAEAYANQETGERGFLLTNDSAELRPYTTGLADAARYRVELGQKLAGEPTSAQLLSTVDDAAAAWRTQSADPDIALARAGELTGATLVQRSAHGEELFATLQTQLSALQNRINQLAASQTEHTQTVQTAGNKVTIIASIVEAIIGAITILVLRKSLVHPLNRLLAQVRRVSSGDLDYSVDTFGPAEVAEVAGAVETMRVRILKETARTAETQQQLARYDEAELIARNLNSTVVARLFTTSMALESTAGRHPAAAPALAASVRDIDQAIRELRSVIFGLATGPSHATLSERVLDLVSDSERSLGFSPQVRLEDDPGVDLPHAVTDELIAMLRDAIAAIARHGSDGDVEISIGASDDRLLLRISGDVGATGEDAVDQLVGLADRTARLGGDCAIRRESDRVIIDWDLPAGEKT